MNTRSTASRSARLAAALTLTAATIGAFSLTTSAQDASSTGIQPPQGLRADTRFTDVTDRPADVVQRYEIVIVEGRRVLESLEAEYARLTNLGDQAAAMAINNRIIGLAERLREFDRQLDVARLSVRAEASVQVSALQNEVNRIQVSREVIANERAAIVSEYEAAVVRQRELEERVGAVTVGLADLRSDIDDRRRRALDLEIERQVSTATVDFLRARIGELLDRIERGIVEDEVVNRLRAAEASQRALVEKSFASPMDVTGIAERRLEREDALADRLGRGLVLQLESRLVDAELKLLTIEVQRRTLERQVTQAGGEVEAAMRSERLRAIELPRLERRLADLDAARDDLDRQLRLRQVGLERAMDQLRRLQEDATPFEASGIADSE